jgi:ribosomal protein L21
MSNQKEKLFSDDDSSVSSEDSEAEEVETVEPVENEEMDVVETDSITTAHDEEVAIVKPAAEKSEVVGAYKKFEEMKKDLLESEDLESISGKHYITKSGWRKIATAFNLSVSVVESVKALEDGVVRYHAKAIAEAPNGRTVEGTGSAGSNESNFTHKVEDLPGEITPEEQGMKTFYSEGHMRALKKPHAVDHHNLRTLACTRAKNRAISDMVGGGEVSAEEIKAINGLA